MTRLDDHAVAVLYRDTRHWLRHYVRGRVTDRDDVDDICSQVFMLALEKLPAEHPSPRGWLAQAANLTIKERARRRDRDRTTMRDYLVLEQASTADARIEIAYETWSRLTPSHREVLQLSLWDRLSTAEIAVALRCSEQSVWKRLSRARQAMRDAWPDQEQDQDQQGRGRVSHGQHATER